MSKPIKIFHIRSDNDAGAQTPCSPVSFTPEIGTANIFDGMSETQTRAYPRSYRESGAEPKTDPQGSWRSGWDTDHQMHVVLN